MKKMLNFFGWTGAVVLTFATPVSLCASDPFSTAESVSDSAAVSIVDKQTDQKICREELSVTGELGLYDILRRALCNNPKTPLALSMTFLLHLRRNDLKALARSRGIPGPLKEAAKRRSKQTE